jgi:DUF1680 family protein
MKTKLLYSLALFALPTTGSQAQAIQNRAAEHPVPETKIEIAATLPKPVLQTTRDGDVALLNGLFHERRALGKAYVERLRTDKLLQNYYLEAGIGSGMPLDELYQGWESPTCQLRGHFFGHWLSAASRFAATDNDAALRQRTTDAVNEIEKCQKLNGDGWLGPIPEKYFTILEDNNRWIWSPQYTLHKTMMGLYDAYRYTGDKDALAAESGSADWFLQWTGKLIAEGKSDVIYKGESSGLLELWSDLYGATGDPRYLKLASRYAMPDMFRQLLDGQDPLTDNHANASIPWVQGAARLYEVTGDARYRAIVENFWMDAVEDRGMFATTGNNAGEFWIPKRQFGRFLGSRTQEHCTVYNMIRVADYLFRWTGDAKYADYIERALYNGILAQQNPQTGMVAYFLPLNPGSKKVWGSETRDFWCCDGTMVQAQAMYEGLIYFNSGDGVTVAQFIPSKANFRGGKIRIEEKVDRDGAPKVFESADDLTHLTVDLAITSTEAAPWTLRVRQPAWAVAAGTVTIDGAPVAAAVSKHGFIEITRAWKNEHVTIAFPKRVTREPLPGSPNLYALLDGPIVLAAASANEPALVKGEALVPVYEHLYTEGRDWQSAHYYARTTTGTVLFKPLYEFADEPYTVYCSDAK